MTTNPSIEAAKAFLADAGYVVLKEASYRRAQERQRIAEALRRAAEDGRESALSWARKVCQDERRLHSRCSYLYGLAKAKGASDAELHGGFRE